MRRVLGGGHGRGGVLGGVDERNDDADGAGVQCLADGGEVVGLHPDHPDGGVPGVDGHEPVEHARVAEQAVLRSRAT